MSLSRLNHWLPGGHAYSEVMQGTADFPSDITNALLPQADPVFDEATTLDIAVDMLDPQSTIVEHLVGFALAHAEQPSLDHLNGVGLQVRTPARINAPVCPRDSLGMSWIPDQPPNRRGVPWGEALPSVGNRALPPALSAMTPWRRRHASGQSG